MTAGWTRLQEAIMRLDGRVSGLEKRLGGASAATDAGSPERPATAEDRRAVLTGAGVAEDLAADIVWREAQYELDRLELRDLAIREGWFRSDRYREELARVEREKPDLRAEIGDDAFDRYLFGAGEDNRVRISSVIAGSSAETVGLNPGDLIERYDGNRVFSFTELREATTGGDRGELVPVEIRRADGRRDQLWLPRGPLGVRMDLIRTDPDA
jgi:S1-C subfamily serine protease